MSCIATAAIIGASAAVASAGYGVYNGQKQQAAQQTALRNQNTAQQTAQAAALSTQRQSEIAQGAANQNTPNIANILYRASSGGSGLSSTMLTGAGGVNTSGLNLGKSTLLGS